LEFFSVVQELVFGAATAVGIGLVHNHTERVVVGGLPLTGKFQRTFVV